MTDPVFVAYYTPRYRDHATEWRRSADAFDLRHLAVSVDDQGSWQANCQQKPVFLLAALLWFPGSPVVWVDVDARFRARPALLLDWEPSCDVAYHVYRLSGGREEPLSGTIWLDDRTGGATRWLTAWAQLCQERPNVYDQVLMGRVDCAGVVVGDLPAEYCFIRDTFRSDFYRRNHPCVGEPVIEHLQASRELSDKVKAE